MPTFQVQTAQRTYPCVVQRGCLQRTAEFIPEKAGKIFVITTRDVWALYAKLLKAGLQGNAHQVLFFPGSEASRRLGPVEMLADQMIEQGADRTSLVIGFGGGIVTDVSGFLAAIFMRGIPVLQIPTTLMAQVDAAVGGKTGVNLVAGKNLIGSFHQPLAVLIDPDVLQSLAPREYRAGLFEVIKCGIIRDPSLFELLEQRVNDVLEMRQELLDQLIASAVRIKAEVVSTDERESGLRRILNFGHTVGHALEAKTEYVRFVHGEAVAYGMLTATRLAELLGVLGAEDAQRIGNTVCAYGPLPMVSDLSPDRIIDRLASDKKTVHGKIHFVLPTRIGDATVRSGFERAMIRQAITEALRDRF